MFWIAFHSHIIHKTSDSSDRFSQQLELWNKFNAHETSISPHTCSPFFVTAPLPFSGFPFPFFGFKGVLLYIILTSCVTTFTSYKSQYARWFISVKISGFTGEYYCNTIRKKETKNLNVFWFVLIALHCCCNKQKK